MSKITRNEATVFLKALSELSIKHEITIAGCGCCGSPWLSRPHDFNGTGAYEIKKPASGAFEGLKFVNRK